LINIEDNILIEILQIGFPKMKADEISKEQIESATKDYEFYNELIKLLKEYISLPNEEEYDIIALWIISTYTYKEIGVGPYIKLHGSKGSGKTAILELCNEFVEHGKILSDASKAQIFRIIQEDTNVLFLDEFENMCKGDKTGIEGILNAGYKKSGKTWRCDGKDENKNFIPNEYLLFCPKMIATTKDIKSETLNDRCIEIITVRAQIRVKSATRISKEDKDRITKIKNLIKIWASKNKGHVGENFDNQSDKIFGRDWELIGPLLSISKALRLEIDIEDYFTSRKLEKQELGLERDWPYQLLRTLKKIVNDEKKEFYVKEISEHFSKTMNNPGLTSATTGRELRKLGLTPRPRTGRGVPYVLCEEDINLLIIRNGYKEYFFEKQDKGEIA